MKRYRAAVVGLGSIGLLYELDERTRVRYPYPTHASAYAVHPRIELVAGCDVHPDRFPPFVQRYPNARVYQDLTKMLRCEMPDIVSVCVPSESQADVIEQLTGEHVRMIFCEKPFGDVESAGRMKVLTATCQRLGIGLAVNYWRRFDESHRRIADLIAAGRIGRLQHLNGYYGNGLLGNASHLINLWLWLVGPIEWVVALPGITDNPQDDNANVLLGFANGTQGSLGSVSYQAYRLLETDLVGTEGRITIANEGLDIKVYDVQLNEDVSGARQLTSEAEQILSTVGVALCRAVDTLVWWLDRDEHPSPDDALDTLAVLEAIKQSAKAGGRRVTVASLKSTMQEVRP